MWQEEAEAGGHRMDYQELLEDDSLLAQASIHICSRAICFYRNGDEDAAQLCEKVEKRWNQFTRFYKVPEDELEKNIRKAIAQTESGMPYGGMGYRRRTYILYITSSLSQVNFENTVKTFQSTAYIDILRITESGKRDWELIPYVHGIRYQWLMDSRYYGCHYGMIFLLISEIYNEKGAYEFMGHMVHQATGSPKCYYMAAGIYDADAQKKAECVKRSLDHALGITLKDRASVSMVEESFFSRFLYSESLIRLIKGQCPHIKDLMISFPGYGRLIERIAVKRDIFYEEVLKSLYGSGKDRMDGPEELLAESDCIIRRECHGQIEKRETELYGYPYGFLIQQGSRLIHKEKIAENHKYKERLALMRRKLREGKTKILGKGAAEVERICGELERELEECLDIRIRAVWWETLEEFVQDFLFRNQELCMEMQECHEFLEEYIIAGRERPEDKLSEADLRGIDWSRSARSYFEDASGKHLQQCSEEDLYRVREWMKWNQQDPQAGGWDSCCFYGADRSLKEPFVARYGEEGNLGDLVFMEGTGRKQIYMVNISVRMEA